MNTPRSIAGLMVAVLLFAVDWVVIQEFHINARNDLYLFVCGFLPMANILALVLLHMIESLRRDGAFGAFSTGFLTAGVVVLFLYTAWCLFTNLELLDPCVGVELQWLGPFVERMGYNHRKLEWKIFGFLSVCAVLTLPQLIASVGGGLMFRKLGVKVVIERTRAKEAAAATKPAASDVS